MCMVLCTYVFILNVHDAMYIRIYIKCAWSYVYLYYVYDVQMKSLHCIIYSSVYLGPGIGDFGL